MSFSTLPLFFFCFFDAILLSIFFRTFSWDVFILFPFELLLKFFNHFFSWEYFLYFRSRCDLVGSIAINIAKVFAFEYFGLSFRFAIFPILSVFIYFSYSFCTLSYSIHQIRSIVNQQIFFYLARSLPGLALVERWNALLLALFTRLVGSAVATAVTTTTSRYGLAVRFPQPVTLMNPTRRCW